MLRRYRHGWLGLLAIVGLCHGCSDEPRRVAVEGHVTIDGEPLEFGSIIFTPEANGPKAGSAIVSGDYRIDAELGPLPGPCTVVIRAPELPTDRPLPTRQTELFKITADAPDRLPPRYNAKSELTAQVTEDGPNEFNFNVTLDEPKP